jgi:hypothetical protein
MSRVFKFFAIAAGTVIGLLVIGIASLAIYATVSENNNRNFIAQRLSIFKAPAGCRESKREYQKSDIDAQSTWDISYVCHTTGGQAYDQIAQNLVSHNFVLHGDFSKGDPIGDWPAKSINYSFTYWGDGVMAEYGFLPDTVMSVSDKQALRDSQVNEIGLSVTKL